MEIRQTFLWIHNALNINVSGVRAPHIVATLAVVLGVLAATFNFASAGTRNEIVPRLKALVEAYLRHPVSEAELNQLYAEEVTDPQKYDADRLNELDEAIGILRNQDGRPAAIHLRHAMLQQVIFEPGKPTVKKALTSLDPIAVSDAKGKKVMTEGDVRAFAQILKFARTNGDPREIEKRRSAQDAPFAAKVTAELRAMIANGGRLPELLPDSSAFWTGLVQNWASLTPDEKQHVRRYIGKNLEGSLTDMPEPLYIRLSGWSTFEFKMANLNKTIQVGQMWAGTRAHMQNLQYLHDTMFSAMHNADGSLR